MVKHVPIESNTRILETGVIRWRWLMPWACRGCRRYGAVEAKIEMNNRSTNAELMDKIERDHRALSATCPVSWKERFVGRLYRWMNGSKVYLRKNGETAEQVKEQKWPPWDE